MACPRRDSRHQNGITVRGLSQLTFATKSAMSRHTEAAQKKSRPWRLLNSNLMIVDQAKRNAVLMVQRAPMVWSSHEPLVSDITPQDGSIGTDNQSYTGVELSVWTDPGK